MSATLNPGFKQLYLYLTKPTNAIDIDDDSTIGNQQAIDNSVREDLIGLKVWASTQQNFDASQTQPVYDGVFNTTTAIQNLADNTTYYIRYAFISAIDETVYTILPAGNPLSEKTLDTNSGITAYLTHDPIEIVTDELGNNPVFTNNTGTFKVYTNTEDVTGNPTVVTYSVVANSATGGVTATIDSNGTYTVTAITDLTGTITLKATGVQFPGVYVDKILNVAKRRPGQTAPLVTITGTGSYFVEMANGNGKYPGSYTWSATTTNITSPQYTWYFGRTSQGALIPVEGTGAEYTNGVLTGLSLNGSKNEVTIQNSVFNNLTPPQEKLLKVVVTSGVQGTNVNVFDQESIFYLQEGSDALVIDLVNENQTISLDKDGNIISPVNILSQILVGRGTDLVTTNITYAIAAVEYITSNQIQLTSAGAITIPSSAVTADSASATFSATVTHPDSTVTTLTKKLTLNRVRDGQTGATGTNISVQLTNDYHAIPTTSTGVIGTYLGANTTLETYINGILQTTGFTYYVSGLQNVKYRDNDDTSDRTATGAVNGLISSFPLQIVELTADSGTIDITAKQTSDNQVFTKTFTVSKNKQGVQGNDSVIYELRASTSAIGKYSIDQTTDGTHTPSTVNFTVYKTIGNQLPQILNDQSLYYIKWTSAQEPANNDSNALQLPSSGVITHVIGNTDDIVHVSVKLLVKNSANNYTQIDREEIPVVFRGAPGLDSVAINLSNDSHPLPIDDSGSVLSYSGATTTGSINLGGVDKTGEWTWTIDLLSSNLGTGGSSGITANIVGSTVTVSGVTSNFLSGIVRLKASKIGYLDSYKDFSISKIKADIYYIELTNDDHYFSADLNGNVTDFTGATTTATVKRGGIDDSANWSFSTPVVTSGITISVSNNNRTVTVIGLTSSFRTGSVTFTATSGVKTLTETFSLVSILQGPKGDQSTVPGSDGKIGLISKIAYLKLTQQDKLLTITTATTTGANSVPTGTYTNANNTSTTATFSPTVPTSIEVGDVVWYAYGRYNPNATALDGVAADKIVWDQPIAASVFQDIKSDNWTGGTPSLGNFGSNPTGYYLNKSEGSLYATSVYLRKETSVDAIKALGSAVTINTTPQVINVKTYNTIKSTIGATYSGQAEASYNDGIIRATIFAGTSYDPSVAWNVGLVVRSKGTPTGPTSEGTNQGLDNNIGIISSATKFGGYFETTTVTGTGLIAKYTNAETPVKANGGYALWVEGNMRWGPSVWTIPPNDNTKFLRSDGEWATAGTPSGGNSANFLRGDGQWTNVLLGDLYVSGEITAYYSSDISLKTNIRKITNPLEKLLSLGGYNFDWAQDYLKKRDSKSGLIKTSDVGIIAQEVQKVMPEVVVTREDGMLAVNYHKLIPLIIEAIAELNNKIDGKQGK